MISMSRMRPLRFQISLEESTGSLSRPESLLKVTDDFQTRLGRSARCVRL